MDTGKITTAGVLFWTPAPAHSSTPSSVISEDEWEPEEEEQTEKDEDFASQMDENGIIGLSEAIEDVELGETCGDANTELNANLNPGPPTLEEADSSENERELSYNLRDPSYIESPEEEEMLSLHDDLLGILKAQKVNEDMSQERKEEQVKVVLPERHFDTAEEAEDGKKTEKSGRKLKKEGFGIISGLSESQISKVETAQISPVQSGSAHQLAMEHFVSNHNCHVSQPASSVTCQTFPHLLHFTAEEMSAAPGIEAEALPDISSAESTQDSPTKSSHTVKLATSPQSAAMFSDIVSDSYSKGSDRALKETVKPDKHLTQPTHSPRKSKLRPPEATYTRTHCLERVTADSMRQATSSNREHRSSRARREAAKEHEARKEPLSYPTPDFSKVEPRVHFPKDGYVPPKSRLSFKRESLSPEPPLVFKSPADIVKEVLLNLTDESPASSDTFGLSSSAPHSVVPQEFRCQQQATTLLNQLQEEHNRLLIKHAEAENTIDRLRLGAKVNLYSDPPKPGYLVQSGVNKEASKILTLDFPRAQRAEINSASLHLNEQSRHQGSSSSCPSTRSPDPQVGQQLAQILHSKAEKFLRQLQTFQDLLKSKTLKPVEQMKGVSQLAEGLHSLEKGFMLTRDVHKLLQQQGADLGPFDSERKLEGLVFQCGLDLEELKEQMKQMQQEEPTCEVPLSPSPHHTSSSVASEGEESQTHPQSPPVPPLVNEREAADVEGNSSSQESKEEILNSLYLDSLKHKCEQDFDELVDHNQSFKELHQSQRDGVPHSAALRTDEEERERQAQGKENSEVHILPQRKADHQDSQVKQQTSRSSPPSGRVLRQSASPPVPCPSRRKSVEMGKSHSSSLSSLGEITASERRNSKLQPRMKSSLLSQDGIISPEMDSGFVGSESSRLTPAAATSPLHQREPKSSVSAPQEGNSGKLQTGPVTASCLAPSPARKLERDSQLDLPRRSRQGQRRRRFSSSVQRRICQLDQSRAERGTSEFWVETDSSVYEDRLNDGSLSSSSSSPAACYHRGNSLRAPSSSQVADPSATVQTLRAELSRLTERLDSCLKNQKLNSSPKTTSSAQQSYIHIHTSTPHDRSDELGSDSCSERRDGPTADDVEESTTRRATEKRPTSAHRRKPRRDVYSESSTPEPQPLVSRSTQTTVSARDRHTAHTSRTQSRQHSGVCETADEPDSRGRTAPLCPESFPCRRGQPESVGSREPPHSSHCHHCLLCECPKHNRRPVPDSRRVSDSTKHTTCQTAQPPPGDVSSRYFTTTAPPAPLHCMAVCPPPILLYSLPLYSAHSTKRSPSSGDRGREEVRMRRSLSVGRRLYVDTSLDRAIRAARRMKNTSGHMAYSLAEGLQYLEQSCSY